MSQGAIGTFYYAGHGIAIDRVNYLIPINADLDVMADVDGEAIRLSKVRNSMESANTQFNFIIVDACRNNPVYRQWPSARRSGSSPQGLAEEKPPRGTMIFYSARYGKTALDGTGRNSPFTSHLLEHIETRNLDISLMIRRVADGVFETTKAQKEPQVPWAEGDVRGSNEFYLNPIEEQQPISIVTEEQLKPDNISEETSPDSDTTPVAEPTPSRITPNEPEPILTSKATSIDYSRLNDLLVARKWKEADQETTDRMLQAAEREQEGWLNSKALNEFSCEDLRIMDRLWLDASQGKFGFSVQKEIWQNNGSPTIYSARTIWRQFYIDVGWKTEDSGTETSEGYVNYDDLGGFTDRVTSKSGNLPGILYDPWEGGVRKITIGWGEEGIFFSRVANCSL